MIPGTGRRRGPNAHSAALVLGLIGGLVIAALAVWGIVDNQRLFLVTTLNGLTLAALYFLVASGFTLVFGLLRTST